MWVPQHKPQSNTFNKSSIWCVGYLTNLKYCNISITVKCFNNKLTLKVKRTKK